jgi:thioredoxin 1
LIPNLTDTNYNDIILNTSTPIFVDFYSPYCGPCQTLLSFLEHLDIQGKKNNVLILKCDVSQNPKIANKYQIESVPFTCIIDIDKSIKYPNFGLQDIGYYVSIIEKSNPERKGFFKKIFSFFN